MIATIPNIKGSDLKPDLLRQFNIQPEQVITVTIQTETEAPLKEVKQGVKRRFKFLHGDVWDDPNIEPDIVESHDKYLYDLDD